MEPQAPPEVKGRQWDYPFGANLSYTPRSEAAISFHELRALADALPLLRLVIETRKDQIAGLGYTIRSRDPRGNAAAAPRIASTLAFLAKPDRRHSFVTWLRLWLEDMLVLDAATLYPRLTLGGDLYSIDVIDGSTITPLIAEDGRTPDPPDPAFQQVLHGVPAADFTSEELLHLPRNPRPHRLHGMSPVEQVALTINIALRREMATLDYYRLGSTGFIATWTIARDDQNAGAPPDGSGQASSSDNKTLSVDPKLIDQLIASGIKISPEKVVATGVMPDGRIVWLETGDADRGLLHIIGDHQKDFAKMGATVADIPQIIMNAVTEGTIVGYQKPGTGRPIFVTTFNGQRYKIAVTVGSNGYIVGANNK